MGILSSLRKNVRNIPGWRTNRKILVLESDDWGSERAQNRQTLDKLRQAGYKVESCLMTMYDALESNTDLELMFELLSSYKDRNGHHPVMTAFFNVANPDYERIKAADFNEYYYLTLKETAEKYPDHNRILDLYKEGINSGVFHAEYHGREHLHVQRWLRDLRACQTDTICGFNLEFNGFSQSYAPDIAKPYRASYEPDMPTDVQFMKESIVDGLALFKNTFGYEAEFFVPPNGLYPRSDSFEYEMKMNGINFLGGPSRQKVPNGKGGVTRKHYSLGSQNQVNQTYITRNGVFEPQSPDREWISYCLEDIEMAFKWHKPAIINTHRTNFMGTLDEKNRKNGLSALKVLLDNIIKEWPEVEFMSSKELNSLIALSNKI